ncbi:MAG: hypothetical protein QXU98_07135, partial [Candidatus Parvarchaeota archaeon]
IERTDFNKQEDVVLKIKKYVLNFLKKNVAIKILEENVKEIKVVCNEDAARSIVNNLKDENGNKLSEELREKLLKHGKINHGIYKGYYFPRLLVGGDKRLEDIKNEKIDDIEEFEKAMAIDASITTALGISLEESASSSIGEFISNIAEKFKAIANSILPILIPAFGGFTASLLIFLFSSSTKKKEFGGEIVKWASVWRRMPIERKEYIAYHYDILFNLSPGESMKILENLFGREDYTDIQNKLNEESSRIDNIENELRDLSDFIKAKFDEYNRRLITVERELLSQIGYVRISGKVDERIMNFLVNNGIKVQLTIKIGKREIILPYVTPESENVQKMFNGEISACIAGLSGSGKSRLLYEVVKKRIVDDKVNDIIVLNTNFTEEQRKKIEETSGIKIELGRIGPGRLRELNFPNNLNDGSERKTFVVWDNFGLGLRQTDAEGFISALNQIEDERNVRYALTLNKDVYSRGVESFDFKNVIDLSEITSTYEYVTELLEKWFSSLLGKKYDRMEDVASLLYKRWGSPQSIYYFINYLIENPNSDPLMVAKKISNEEFKTYVERQFELLDAPKRDYLAAVKITNTIFNHPTFKKVEEMWKRMKSGDLAEPLNKLSAFLYLSQGEIKMHDLYQELFKFSPDQLKAVFDYLKESSNDYKSIYQMIGNESEDYNLHGLASLIGKYSCDYMSIEELKEILLPSSSLPSSSFDMHKFFFDLGKSFGENFKSLNHDFQAKIVKLANLVEYIEFAEGLGYGLGSIFDRLQENVQEKLIELTKRNKELANELGYGVGEIFDRLKEDVQGKLIELTKRNESFANGLGSGIRRIFDSLKGDVQEKLIELAKENENFANELGFGVGSIFDRLKGDIQEKLIELAKENENFANILGYGVGSIFDRLKGNIQEKLIELAKENENFANGVSYGVGIKFHRLKGNIQEKLIELAKENEKFANRLGFGVGEIFDRLKGDVQEKLIELAKENEKFANRLGYGVGSKFYRLKGDVQEKLIELAKENEKFANGLGCGVGSILHRLKGDIQEKLIELARENKYIAKENKYIAYDLGCDVGSILHRLKGVIQEKLIELAKENEKFANGLGCGVGEIFDRLKGDVQEKLIELAKENEKFANGLGCGVGEIFDRLKGDVQKKLIELAKENEKFAYGLGYGVGRIFDSFKEDVQKKLIEFAKENKDFAYGLGYGVGSILHSFKEDVQKKLIEFAKENKDFAYGLGYGVGSIFDSFKEDVQKKLIEFAKENKDFAYGLGYGVRYIFDRLKEDVQKKLKKLASKNERFGNN